MNLYRLTGKALFTAGLLVWTAPLYAAELLFAHTFDSDEPQAMGAEAFADTVGSCTQGNVTVEVSTNGEYGSEQEINQLVRSGELDFGNVHDFNLMPGYTPVGIQALPYVFRDRDHVRAYARTARTGGVLRDVMDDWSATEEGEGGILLSASYILTYHIYSNEHYREPEELEGVRLRTRLPDVPIGRVFLESVGAEPVLIALSEASDAIERGEVVGTGSGHRIVQGRGIIQLAPAVTLAAYQHELQYLLTGEHVREQLPSGYWACIGAGSRVYARTVEEEFQRLEEAAVEDLVAAGADFVEPNLANYRRAGALVVEERINAGEISEELIERIDGVSYQE